MNRTVSLRDLRRVYGHALLVVAPLAVAGCRESPAPVTADARPPGTSSATVATATASATATAAKGTCAAEKPNITGCGGAEVVLIDSPEACGLPREGDVPKARCDALCAGFETRACNVTTNRDKKPMVYCHAAHPCMGRPMADGWGEAFPPSATPRDFFAYARRMEAQSVDAFRELEADLARFGAPARLLRACRRAAADEARHADAMTELLVARGAAASPVEPRTSEPFGSLLALALHNERYGVVGETWGALLAAHQAEHAEDADIRAAMRVIAREEAEHAALSFRIAEWARRQLGDAEVAILDRTRREAFDALEAPASPPALGFPSAPASKAMRAVLEPVVVPRAA